MRHRVLVAAALTDAALEEARARFDILYEPAAATEPGQMPSLAAAHNAVAVVLGSRTKVPASEIERLPKAVKMVATVSVGFDHIDGGQQDERLGALATPRRHHHAVAACRQPAHDGAPDESAAAQYQNPAHGMLSRSMKK